MTTIEEKVNEQHSLEVLFGFAICSTMILASLRNRTTEVGERQIALL